MGFKKTMNQILQGVIYYAFRAFQYGSQRSMLAKWTAISSESKRGVVILHCFDAAKTIPNMSGFVLKLETFMRMANIKYTIDNKDPLGPKGKSPWISFNGENIGDSQLIVEFLTKKFEVNLNRSLTEEHKALATVVRVTMEEHIFWGFSLWAFDQDSTQSIRSTEGLPWYAFAFVSYNVRKIAWGHGIGRHSEQDIIHLLSNSIRAVSALLGTKKYLLGNEPCTEDASVFGFMAQIIWGLGSGSGSPYRKLVEEELPNIKEYCQRMKEKYWPDWEDCLAK